MIALKVLLASNDPGDVLSLGRIQQMPGVEIMVEVVSTLQAVREKADESNVIILHLHLADAGPDEVIAAIPELPEPVIVWTKTTAAEVHARCKMAGALVLVDGVTRHNEMCSSILHCLARSVMNAVKNLPE